VNADPPFAVGARNGWEVLTLAAGGLAVEVVPAKGCDITRVQVAPRGLDLLWRPRDLPPRTTVDPASDTTEAFLDQYCGGWQTLFPNAGVPAEFGGAVHPYHGEALRREWSWRLVSAHAERVEVEAWVTLTHLPFTLRRRIVVEGSTLTVVETAANQGPSPKRVMWVHHPAFGPPLLGPETTLEHHAGRVVADPGVVDATDVADGADLTRVPPPGAGLSRMAYLLDFAVGRAVLTNPVVGLRAALQWDAAVLPHAWYWLESRPEPLPALAWDPSPYVLAIEPASGYPGGIANAAPMGGTIEFRPGEAKTLTVSLTGEDWEQGSRR
jgi:galactose mutarotase-like enzyme